MTKLRFHAFVEGKYSLQGPSVEKDGPLSQREKQKIINDFFTWLKGDQSKLKLEIAKGNATIDIDKGKGFESVAGMRLRFEIIRDIGSEPKDDLTIEQLRKIKSRRLFAARFFK